MRSSIRARQKALDARLHTCVEAAIPYEKTNPAKWREVSMLVLDMVVASAHAVERQLREMIADLPRSRFKPLTISHEELDEYEAQVCELERTLRLDSASQITEGGFSCNQSR